MPRTERKLMPIESTQKHATSTPDLWILAKSIQRHACFCGCLLTADKKHNSNAFSAHVCSRHWGHLRDILSNALKHKSYADSECGYQYLTNSCHSSGVSVTILSQLLFNLFFSVTATYNFLKAVCHDAQPDRNWRCHRLQRSSWSFSAKSINQFV